MPYPSNEPRWEFSNTDRTTMAGLAVQALAGLAALTSNPVVNNGYFPQIVGRSTVTRNSFDTMVGQILNLTPTFNSTPPLIDVRP